jgi:hypothetical protein
MTTIELQFLKLLLADLVAGKFISITGKTNTHGSVTAQSIQLRTAPAAIPTPNQTQR